MPIASEIKDGRKPGKRLLVVALLLSFFSFSGYAGGVQVQVSAVAQTELMVRETPAVRQQAAFFAIAKSRSCFQAPLTLISWAHDCTIRTRFARLLARFLTFKPALSLFIYSKIPSLGNEPGSIFQRG